MAAPWQLRDHLTNNVAAGPTRDFLVQRLDKIGRIYSANGNVLGQSDMDAINDYLSTGNTDGLFDAVNDLNYTSLMDAVHNITSEVDYDHVGRAGFQGLVYTNGRFYAANEISVRGAVVVNNNTGATGAEDFDGVTLEPGDLYLADDCNITFVEQFFDDSGAAAEYPRWSFGWRRVPVVGTPQETVTSRIDTFGPNQPVDTYLNSGRVIAPNLDEGRFGLEASLSGAPLVRMTFRSDKKRYGTERLESYGVNSVVHLRN